MGNYVCDCCGYRTLDEPRGSYQICEVCFWQDDGYIDEEGYYDTGANHVKLSEAQSNFKKFKAYEKRVLNYVRNPGTSEPYLGELRGFKD